MQTKVGNFTKNTATGTQAITGVGFTPKLVFFFTAGATADATFQAGIRGCVGVAVSTSSNGNASIGIFDVDNVAASVDGESAHRNCINFVDNPSGIAGQGQEDKADLQSWDVDGFTLNWSQNNTGRAAIIHYLALYDPAMQVSLIEWTTPTSTGNKSATGAGFKPDFVFHIGTSSGNQDTFVGAYGPAFGAMDANNNQWSMSLGATTNANPTNSNREYLLTACYRNTFANHTATMVSMDADGFTLNFSAVSGTACYMRSVCIRGIRTQVGSITKTTAAATASQVITGLNHTPKALLLMSTFSTATGSQASARMGIGATDGSNVEACAWQSTTAITPSSTDCYDASNRKLFVVVDNNTPAVSSECDLTSLDYRGFTVSWTTNAAVATVIPFISFAGPEQDPTLAFICGGECGTDKAHWTTSGAKALLYDTTTVRPGGSVRSLRLNPATQTCRANTANISNFTSTKPNVAIRGYIRFATLPGGNIFLIGQGAGTGATAWSGLGFQQSDSTLRPVYLTGTTFTFGSTGFVVATGIWYKFSILAQRDLTNYVATIRIDNSTDLGSVSAANTTSSTSTALFIGYSGANWSGDVYLDDISVSSFIEDYENMGNGRIVSFVPSSDGTHTATSTHITKGTTGTPVGTAITSATTDAFNWVNNRPLLGGATDNTRLINQQTVAAIEYVEFGIEQTTQIVPPRAIEVLVAHMEAAAQNCTSITKLNDNGTEVTVFSKSGAGSNNVDVFERASFPVMADNAKWTLARFKALKLRYGYSDDATPDVYCRGLMIEADFPEYSLPVFQRRNYSWSKR